MNYSFNELFKSMMDTINSGFGGILSIIDKRLFIRLVNCLKYNDIGAVKTALDSLVEEKNKLAIAPIYLTHKKHPNPVVRQLCREALCKIDNIDKITRITQNKDDRESMEALIKEYGNYRYD